MGIEHYQDPVAKLLTYGDCRELDHKHWDNYLELVGLSEANISDLIQLAIDRTFWDMDSDRVEVWAPVHAWRALAQLKAEEAIVPLLDLLEADDDWVVEELPLVYAMIGPASIPPLANYLLDSSHKAFPRMTAGTALQEIGQAYPDHREQCLSPLVQQLEEFQDNAIELNDSLVYDLIKLQAVEAAPLLEQVFASEKITEFMVGTWANVQVDLGLKKKEDFSPAELTPKVPEHLANIRKLLDMFESQNRETKGFSTKPSSTVKHTAKKKKKKK